MSPVYAHDRARLFESDCLVWLRNRSPQSLHACVTDPPYGLVEYSPTQQEKLRAGRGGVWRQPPSFDGHRRAPLPRFTTLRRKDFETLSLFFGEWAAALFPVLVPGSHVLIASNPLVSHWVAHAVRAAGFERRGEVVRLVMTMRGGDRPKNAHAEFPDVTVLPRSMYEPWLAVPQTPRRTCSRQPQEMEDRRASPGFCPPTLRRRNPVQSDSTRRASARSSSELEAAGVSATSGPGDSTAR